MTITIENIMLERRIGENSLAKLLNKCRHEILSGGTIDIGGGIINSLTDLATFNKWADEQTAMNKDALLMWEWNSLSFAEGKEIAEEDGEIIYQDSLSPGDISQRTFYKLYDFYVLIKVDWENRWEEEIQMKSYLYIPDGIAQELKGQERMD